MTEIELLHEAITTLTDERNRLRIKLEMAKETLNFYAQNDLHCKEFNFLDFLDILDNVKRAKAVLEKL